MYGPTTSAGKRNTEPIKNALNPFLSNLPGPVLEIGSGTGQHLAALAATFLEVEFWPTDPDPFHRENIDEWRKKNTLPNLKAARSLDLLSKNWHSQFTNTLSVKSFSAIICINVLHISPYAAMEGLLLNAKNILSPKGLLYIYGPFKMNNVFAAPSDKKFDAYLKMKNPAWGLRDLNDVRKIAALGGLSLIKKEKMPANNLSLFFRQD